MGNVKIVLCSRNQQEGLTGRPVDLITRMKISKATIGYKRTEQMRKAISDGKRGKPWTPKHYISRGLPVPSSRQ